MHIAVAAKALVLDAEENLLVLRRSSTHPYFAFHPDIPGGEANQDESPVATLIRELWEETGLSVMSGRLQHLETRYDTFYRAYHHFYQLHLRAVKPEITISWEHDQFEWIPLEEFASKQYPANLEPLMSRLQIWLKEKYLQMHPLPIA